jgi:hypothetical protein
MSRHYSFPSLVSAPHHYCRRRSFISSCLSPHHLSDNYTENRNDVLLSCQRPGRPLPYTRFASRTGSNSFTDHDRIALCIVAHLLPSCHTMRSAITSLKLVLKRSIAPTREAVDHYSRRARWTTLLWWTHQILLLSCHPMVLRGACCSLKHFSGYLTGLQV